MPKVELTEELKRDLKAIQYRSHIFPNKFYKRNESSKLPQYFQVGRVVDGPGGMPDERPKRRERKGGIAEQFLREDESRQFSKRKYEGANDRLRRMGEKKRKLKLMRKVKHRVKRAAKK